MSGGPSPVLPAGPLLELVHARSHQHTQDLFAIEGRRSEPAAERPAVSCGIVRLIVEDDLAKSAREKDPRSNRGDVTHIQKSLGVRQPFRTSHGVVVEKGNYVSTRRGHAGINAAGKALVLCQADNLDPRAASIGCDGPVHRAVVDQDDLVRLIDNRVEAPCQPTGRLERNNDYRGPQVVAFNVERSITRSMKPYSRASWAVNQRSRSESASIRSMGWPVCRAIRSAIMRFR